MNSNIIVGKCIYCKNNAIAYMENVYVCIDCHKKKSIEINKIIDKHLGTGYANNHIKFSNWCIASPKTFMTCINLIKFLYDNNGAYRNTVNYVNVQLYLKLCKKNHVHIDGSYDITFMYSKKPDCITMKYPRINNIRKSIRF